MSAGSIDIRVREEAVVREERHSLTFNGFHAERVIVGGKVAYDYDTMGSSQYIAIHDIELRDGEIRVDGGRPEHVVDLRGRITYAPRGCALSGWVSTVDRTNSFTSITFDERVLAQETESNRAGDGSMPIVHFRDRRLEGTLWKLDAALQSPGAPNALYLETLALTALLELGQLSGHQLARPPESGRLSPLTEKRMRDFIDQNLASNMTLAEMASVAGLSRFHFSRAFKNTFGLSPVDYVLWARIEAAKGLIAHTDIPISEVALRVGFSNPDRLTAAFRRFMSQTPSQFRRSLR